MRTRTARSSAAALLAAAALGASTAVAACSSASAAPAAPASVASVANAGVPGTHTACASIAVSVTGMSAAEAVRTVAANMSRNCGFTVSGSFDGAGFGLDGWELYGTSTYGAFGDVHIVSLDQGMVINFYRVGSAEYLRVYEVDAPNAAPDVNVRAQLRSYGISNAVINAAGSAKWIKLTAAQRKTFNSTAFEPLTAAALGAAVAQGSQEPWQLGGTKTLNGVRYLVLTDPVNKSGVGYLGESMYVNPSTGLPAEIKYVSQDSQQVSSSFGDWNHTPEVTAPPASKVVTG
jgi:hypothetical protein